MSPTLGLEMCQKCGCYEAHYLLMYDDPETREVVEFHLCRPCQMMMVNTIRRCQGLFDRGA